ncbi:MAG: polysaccharide deacetylase family protein, partial [candidate division KSB1 bacterium]|nr:polysaccharide deacetylase family protein [candidate division KSB1 bacterium]
MKKPLHNLLYKLWQLRGVDRWESLMADLSHAIALERFGPRLARRILWRVTTQEKIIALSFDDGPHPRYTPEILDLLDEHQIPATFFLIGRHVRRHPELARRLASGPHEIGNHTFNHDMLPFLRTEKIIHEIRQTGEVLAEVTGRSAKYFRPPMGLFTRRVVDLVKSCGYEMVIGDVYPRDPHRPGREKIYHRVISRTRPGSIIILHDGGNTRDVERNQTVWATRQIVRHLQRENYRFVTISELACLDGQ